MQPSCATNHLVPHRAAPYTIEDPASGCSAVWRKNNWVSQCHLLAKQVCSHTDMLQTEAGRNYLPLNEGAKEQSDGLLYVLSAQPTPLVLHQQTQNVQSNICHSCVCSNKYKQVQWDTFKHIWHTVQTKHINGGRWLQEMLTKHLNKQWSFAAPKWWSCITACWSNATLPCWHFGRN